MFRTIKSAAAAEIIEKKSKFIGQIFYVETLKEAERILEETRKKYHDARHNCYAYRILDGNIINEKQSDDGEPSGTAGAPMLNILQKKELTNVLVIVTRYFGGILLGTGGLVKAYSEATTEVILNAGEIRKEKGYLLEINLDYDEQGIFEYICKKNKINIVLKEYTEKIKNLIEISEEKYNILFQKNEKESFQNFPVNIKENKFVKCD